jgi:hypothetical protein
MPREAGRKAGADKGTRKAATAYYWASTGAGAAPEPSPMRRSQAPQCPPLKYFFLLVSIGLFVSTLSGIYMSYKYIRNRKLITALLVAGTVLPVLLTIY